MSTALPTMSTRTFGPFGDSRLSELSYINNWPPSATYIKLRPLKGWSHTMPVTSSLWSVRTPGKGFVRICEPAGFPGTYIERQLAAPAETWQPVEPIQRFVPSKVSTPGMSLGALVPNGTVFLIVIGLV